MKKTLLALAVWGVFSTTAYAQSSVTIYGVIDTAIRYTTNQVVPNGTLGSQTAMMGGGFQGSRVGFKGSEDLGGGTSAVFQLENGFLSNNGGFDQQGQLFGRQAYVGLKDTSWGELDIGRQYGIAADILSSYDPLWMGNFIENEWPAAVYGIRFDNSLRYTKSFGPFTAKVQYSIGGKAGETGIGATSGGALTYTQGAVSIGGVYQQSKDANSARMKLAGLGGVYMTGPMTLFLQYFNARRDPGFATAFPNSGGALANTSMIWNYGNTLKRTDGVWTAGFIYQMTPTVGLTVGYMNDTIKNVSSAGDSGRVSTLYAIADYHLSKRTDIYIEVDRTTLAGGEIQDLNGIMVAAGASLGAGMPNAASSRNGVGIGLRTKF
ncbi:porin [Glaciimonas soli]|uniref:Porin n=1 Tax=Glaciimonas soli TaxID=2590999 RepID=A0A843YXB0_9BURK|nr:porin [Glaciimonas soli]MQR02373.1 porin [Glaciimonas soli]